LGDYPFCVPHIQDIHLPNQDDRRLDPRREQPADHPRWRRLPPSRPRRLRHQLGNLYVRMLRQIGAEVDRFGTSTGVVSELG
jgi:hypothetical protein